MAGTGYTFATAARLTGLPVSAIEAAARGGDVRVFRLNGEKVVNAEGLAYLQGVAKARSEAFTGAGPTERSVAGGEDPKDPASWSDETIKANGKKLADSIRGTAGSLLETTVDVRLRG